MDEEKAGNLARILNGELWNSGGGLFLAIVRRSDGKIVAFSDEVVCEYADEEALNGGTPSNSIYLI